MSCSARRAVSCTIGLHLVGWTAPSSTTHVVCRGYPGSYPPQLVSAQQEECILLSNTISILWHDSSLFSTWLFLVLACGLWWSSAGVIAPFLGVRDDRLCSITIYQGTCELLYTSISSYILILQWFCFNWVVFTLTQYIFKIDWRKSRLDEK